MGNGQRLFVGFPKNFWHAEVFFNSKALEFSFEGFTFKSDAKFVLRDFGSAWIGNGFIDEDAAAVLAGDDFLMQPDFQLYLWGHGVEAAAAGVAFYGHHG